MVMNQASTGRHGWLMTAATTAASVMLGVSILATADSGQAQSGQSDAAGSTTPAAAAPSSQSAAGSTRLEDIGPEAFNLIGEETTVKVCTACHGFNEIFTVRRTLRDWEIVVRDMAGRGAVATQQELDLITRYLTWSWGLVPVNSASADELSLVLGLSKKDAEAVVAYRTEHGPFADLDGLKRVPGIDTEVLTEFAGAVLFK